MAPMEAVEMAARAAWAAPRTRPHLHQPYPQRGYLRPPPRACECRARWRGWLELHPRRRSARRCARCRQSSALGNAARPRMPLAVQKAQCSAAPPPPRGGRRSRCPVCPCTSKRSCRADRGCAKRTARRWGCRRMCTAHHAIARSHSVRGC